MKEKDSWELRCSEERFEDLKNDERFWTILTLARALNALRFCQMAYFAMPDEDTPAAMRQRINSFVFTGAVLYEALEFAQTLGEYFHDLPEFRETWGTLFRDRELREFRETSLHRLRNTFVFHFDREIAPQALQGFRKAPYIFDSGQGATIGNAYYSLADLASLYFLVKEEDDDHLSAEELEEIFKARFVLLMQRMLDLSRRFGTAADELIAVALKELDPAARIHYLPANKGGFILATLKRIANALDVSAGRLLKWIGVHRGAQTHRKRLD